MSTKARRNKLHDYVNHMDEFQLELVVSFLETLFDLKEENS